ncbi:MAG: hypothetical protein WKF73_22645 [Nocardioidaceae bacterium]
MELIDQLLAAATPVDGVDRDGSMALAFTVTGGKIVAINVLADPERLHNLDLTVLDE